MCPLSLLGLFGWVVNRFIKMKIALVDIALVEKSGIHPKKERARKKKKKKRRTYILYFIFYIP